VEATVGALAESFTSRRVVAQMLCVSDDSGAQTCVTKAQLDSLLSSVSHAEISQPSVSVTEAKAVPTEEPVETLVPKDTSRYSEQNGAVEEKSVADQEPEHTGTVRSASSGAAIVLYPEVEVMVEPAPVEAAPGEPAAASDD
jgi:hypothetical protein